MGEIKTEYDKLFIGGKWTEPSTSEVIEVRCPATGEYFGKTPLAAAADVDAAVAAARAAFDNGPCRRRRRKSARPSSPMWSS
jgi:aldehyde dehydrogenase (NAD+)